MADLPFLKQQRNQVFELVRRHGLDPDEFEWRTATREVLIDIEHRRIPVPVLIRRQTSYYFEFGVAAGMTLEEVSRYSPGDEYIVTACRAYGWKDRLRHVDQWLVNLKREMEEPDLWEEWKRRGTLLTDLTGDIRNSPFCAAEIESVTLELTNLRKVIEKKFGQSLDHAKIIEAKIGYLQESLKRVGRIDWRNILIGSLMQIGLELALTQVQWKELLQLAWTALGKFFNVPQIPQ